MFFTGLVEAEISSLFACRPRPDVKLTCRNTRAIIGHCDLNRNVGDGDA